MSVARIAPPDLAWTVAAAVPFRGWKGWSKNTIWAARAYSYGRRLTPAAAANREELMIRLQEKLRGLEWRRKVPIWVWIRMGRPDMKGDPVNVADLVLDAVQLATGVDDRYFKLGGLDWEIAEEDPWILVTIGQEAPDGRK